MTVVDMFTFLNSAFLNLGHAAIDEQLDACDVAAVVRGEEHGGVRHLVRRAHPAQRYGGDDVRLHLVDLLPRPPRACRSQAFRSDRR